MQQRAKRQHAAAASSLADLQERVTFLVRELAEVRKQQTATSEVLQEREKLSAEL